LHSVQTWWTTTRMDLYVPVTYTTWGIIALMARDAQTGQLDPAYFHTANLILHVLCCLVVFELLRLLIGKTWPAVAGALLFGLHPVQVEAVAWVSGLKDVLGGLLALLAIWQYLVVAKRNRGDWHYAIATVTFALAILAKPNELVVPVIAGILDIWLIGRPWRRALAWLWPWLVLSAACVVEGWIVQPPNGVTHNVAIYLRPFVAIASLGFYVRKLLWPMNLAVDYGLQPSLIVQSRWLVADAAFVACAAVGLWAARRSARPMVVGAVVFVAALLPVLGFVTFDFQWFSTVADHYLYLPMFGIALMSAWLAARCSGRIMAAGSMAVLGALSVVSFNQTQYWKDSKTLFTRVEEVNPASAAAADALALAALKQGDVSDAIHWSQETIRLRPGNPLGYIAYAMSLARNHQTDAAIEQYRKALAFDPHDISTINDLATLLVRAGKLSEAIDEFKLAVTLDPRSARDRIALAAVLEHAGRHAEALEQYNAALRLNPAAIARGRDLSK
jgi:protein O-mannosyl-transferase